jgi:uncharacterized protein (TIGR02301 family)
MRRIAAVISSLAALIAANASVAAAETSAPKSDAKSAPAPAAPPPPTPVERPPPYEPQLLRLAEMMGALAYLRDLCGAGDGADFRAKMTALLDVEGVGESQRDLLAGAYNKGFRDYATTYRVCTPAAGEVISRYLKETARVATDVASRYGG